MARNELRRSSSSGPPPAPFPKLSTSFGQGRRALGLARPGEGITSIDYKDSDPLRKFLSDRGKILPLPPAGRCPHRRVTRVTRVTAQQRRRLARAIKNAREMALLPYASR
ncbi:30S ribosomal protein S18 [Streptomyces inhibens]|uniref:30S ribosomal protein S18 n=1 Tax=Streptomyces inhibens TaxID=2293571 RepID=UPI00402AE3A0